MKASEIFNAGKEELDKKLVELKTELMKINTQVAVGTMLKSTGRPRLVKKAIARINTIKSLKEEKTLHAKEVKKTKAGEEKKG